ALAAAARAKPVLAYKLGRSSAARDLAATHTGALAGEDDVANAFLTDCGIARVETFEALIEGLPLLARVPARSRDAQPSAATFARLAAAGIKAAQARIVDLTIAGANYEAVKATLDILLSAPEF